MTTLKEFDPLDEKTSDNTIAEQAIRREISNILYSYVGWYDPFCEIIQNSLDSIEELQSTNRKYKSKLNVIIDLKLNLLTVSDVIDRPR